MQYRSASEHFELGISATRIAAIGLLFLINGCWEVAAPMLGVGTVGAGVAVAAVKHGSGNGQTSGSSNEKESSVSSEQESTAINEQQSDVSNEQKSTLISHHSKDLSIDTVDPNHLQVSSQPARPSPMVSASVPTINSANSPAKLASRPVDSDPPYHGREIAQRRRRSRKRALISRKRALIRATLPTPKMSPLLPETILVHDSSSE
jgi:hypothetical protein